MAARAYVPLWQGLRLPAALCAIREKGFYLPHHDYFERATLQVGRCSQRVGVLYVVSYATSTRLRRHAALRASARASSVPTAAAARRKAEPQRPAARRKRNPRRNGDGFSRRIGRSIGMRRCRRGAAAARTAHT